ncbi:MAG: membrane biogenesis protein, partial [Cyclobacteriaceae bacterium]|nr:membrane biogenesis protein [Cyclobacteriaceae bacterium]
MELEIVDGELKNYKPLNALSDYFKNKNLSKIRFDTLSNKLNVTNGIITIPSMTINSTLGYMDISGTQDMHNHMEYYFRIPMKMVTKTARHKLFGKKGAISDSTQIDVIHYKYTSKKTWYLNLKLIGDPDDFKVSLGRKK